MRKKIEVDCGCIDKAIPLPAWPRPGAPWPEDDLEGTAWELFKAAYYNESYERREDEKRAGSGQPLLGGLGRMLAKKAPKKGPFDDATIVAVNLWIETFLPLEERKVTFSLYSEEFVEQNKHMRKFRGHYNYFTHFEMSHMHLVADWLRNNGLSEAVAAYHPYHYVDEAAWLLLGMNPGDGPDTVGIYKPDKKRLKCHLIPGSHSVADAREKGAVFSRFCDVYAPFASGVLPPGTYGAFLVKTDGAGCVVEGIEHEAGPRGCTSAYCRRLAVDTIEDEKPRSEWHAVDLSFRTR